MNNDFYDRIGLFLGYDFKKTLDVDFGTEKEFKVSCEEINEGYKTLTEKLTNIKNLFNECFVNPNAEPYRHFVKNLKYNIKVELFSSHLQSFIELVEKFNDALAPVTPENCDSIHNGVALLKKKIAARDPSYLGSLPNGVHYANLFNSRSSLTYLKENFEKILSEYQWKLISTVDKEKIENMSSSERSYLQHNRHVGTTISENEMNSHDKIDEIYTSALYLLHLEKNVHKFLLLPDASAKKGNIDEMTLKSTGCVGRKYAKYRYKGNLY